MTATIVQKWFDEASKSPRRLPKYKESYRVLVAAPIAGHKQYGMAAWLDWVSRQDHANVEICLCANGDNKIELMEKIRETKVVHKSGVVVPVFGIMLGDEDKKMTRLERIVAGREACMKMARGGNFDAILFLDTDTIPLRMDAIKELFDCAADAASGLYFYKNSAVPVACDTETGTNFSPEKLEQSVKDHCPVQASVGMGCVLMRGRAMHVPFMYRDEFKSEDFIWCELAAQKRIPVWLLPWVVCKHLEDKI